MKGIPLLLALLAASGCTYKGVYENIQLNRHNKCMQEPPGRYETCMDRIDKSYAEYEKELEEYERQREEYEGDR